MERVINIVLADEFGELDRTSVVARRGVDTGEATVVATVLLLRRLGALLPGDVLRVTEEA